MQQVGSFPVLRSCQGTLTSPGLKPLTATPSKVRPPAQQWQVARHRPHLQEDHPRGTDGGSATVKVDWSNGGLVDRVHGFPDRSAEPSFPQRPCSKPTSCVQSPSFPEARRCQELSSPGTRKYARSMCLYSLVSHSHSLPSRPSVSILTFC